MTNEQIHNSATSNVLAWTSQEGHLQHAPEDEVAAEVDEPPDQGPGPFDPDSQFKRSTVPKTAEQSESLLTKALHHSEGGNVKFYYQTPPTRRRSLNSSISVASTADLTSDTGLTSPARTNTPSPPPPVVSLARLNGDLYSMKQKVPSPGESRPHVIPTQPTSIPTQPCNEKRDPAMEALQKKRCISFACGPKPEARKPTSPPQPVEIKPATDEKPQRKTCIKFACPAKPSFHSASPRREQQPPNTSPTETPTKQKASSPMASRKYRSPSVNQGRHQRSLTPRPNGQSPMTTRSSKYITANANDLNTESSHFHEFASDEPLEEDWIRQNLPLTCARLTINDTLRKENEIRRLGKEAEEEALEEEEEEESEGEEEQDQEGIDAEIDEDDTGLMGDLGGDEDAEDEDGFDDHSTYGSDDIASDGYNTDNEIGFADSDDEDDGDLQLWTTGNGLALRLSNDTPIYRCPSLNGDRSDSSSDGANTGSRIREKSRRIKIRPGTPELPDSTDFVCGTLDEDRAIEDAYISCMAARRREKLHPIPQDIDPSFPTSEPEDEEIEPHRHGHESDEQLWIHGELEDLHHTRDQDGDRRKKKSGHTSPKRYHSPPPKSRGRSPRRLFDRHSPRRLVSPPPGRVMRSPPASLVHGGPFGNPQFKTLAFRPGLTHTKSLPRAPALFPQHVKCPRRVGKLVQSGGHVRGAIDIVKGLEQKRQRRREKFKEKYLQKHNNKARKGQLPQRPQPGKGAERMREIGLLSAGKLGPDQYVLSI